MGRCRKIISGAVCLGAALLAWGWPHALWLGNLVDSPPSPPEMYFYWAPGETGARTNTLVNPNDADMIITMGAFTNWRISWLTSWPIRIPAHGQSNVLASYGGGYAYAIWTGATGTWSVVGGTTGPMEAWAEKDE